MIARPLNRGSEPAADQKADIGLRIDPRAGAGADELGRVVGIAAGSCPDGRSAQFGATRGITPSVLTEKPTGTGSPCVPEDTERAVAVPVARQIFGEELRQHPPDPVRQPLRFFVADRAVVKDLRQVIRRRLRHGAQQQEKRRRSRRHERNQHSEKQPARSAFSSVPPVGDLLLQARRS